jgi:hypothetical protein
MNKNTTVKVCAHCILDWTSQQTITLDPAPQVTDGVMLGYFCMTPLEHGQGRVRLRFNLLFALATMNVGMRDYAAPPLSQRDAWDTHTHTTRFHTYYKYFKTKVKQTL